MSGIDPVAQLVRETDALLRPDLRPITSAELLSLRLPPRPWILEPVIPGRGLAMLYAPRGIGKTWMALSIAYTVASGAALCGWQAPEPVPVLYVDGEMQAETMQQRLAAVVAGTTEAPPTADMLQFLCADLHELGLPDLRDLLAQEAIVELCEASGTKLLVLDNLSSLCRSGRENEADSWQPVQDFLLRLRRKGVSVLLVHHAGKGGQQRGTSRREDVLDTVIALRRPVDYDPAEGARFEVHVEKSRVCAGEAVAPFELRLEERNGAAVWTRRSLEDAELRRVADLLEQGLRHRDIADELGISLGKVAKLARRAEEEGLLTERPKRGGRAGRHFDGTAEGRLDG